MFIMADAFLPFAFPSITDAEIQEVVASLKSGWLTTGPKVQKFEELLRAYTGAPHALCLNSATAGLHVALLALDLQPGDEVITSAMTFIATYNTIEQAGGRVVPVDIDPKTYNLDVNLLERAITPKTRALVPVHFTGVPVDLDPLYALAKKYNLRVVEDAAQAIGTCYKGKKLGSFGDTIVFSFHPNKNITSGEGGCVITFDEALAQKIKVLRFHGIDRDAWNRFSKSGSQEYDVIRPGFKYNMLDLEAAIGIHQLPRLEEFIQQRTQLAQRYMDAFADCPAIQLPQVPTFTHEHSWHLFTVQVKPEIAKLTRNEFMQAMKEHNIGTGLHYQAPFLYSYYRQKYNFSTQQFPHAAQLGECIVSLPLYPSLKTHDQDRVIMAMRTILA
jgi:dTDP-4-amino-4,6-dideoxygalactose transaminase